MSDNTAGALLILYHTAGVVFGWILKTWASDRKPRKCSHDWDRFISHSHFPDGAKAPEATPMNVVSVCKKCHETELWLGGKLWHGTLDREIGL